MRKGSWQSCRSSCTGYMRFFPLAVRPAQIPPNRCSCYSPTIASARSRCCISNITATNETVPLEEIPPVNRSILPTSSRTASSVNVKFPQSNLACHAHPEMYITCHTHKHETNTHKNISVPWNGLQIVCTCMGESCSWDNWSSTWIGYSKQPDTTSISVILVLRKSICTNGIGRTKR